jgi:hypothetical protein
MYLVLIINPERVEYRWDQVEGETSSMLRLKSPEIGVRHE